MALKPLSLFGALLLLVTAACATPSIPGEDVGGGGSAQTGRSTGETGETGETPGAPAPPSCTGTSCGGSCVDIKTSVENCGACGSKCAGGSTCENGFCSSEGSCAADKLACGSKCIDPLTDKDNCGSCGRSCGDTGVCTQGGCPTQFHVRALIDGHSQLELTGAKAKWHHTDAAAPGLWNGHHDPTTLGAMAWTPVWPQPTDNYSCNCDSQSSPNVSAPLMAIDQIVTVTKIAGRGGVGISQQPTAENGYTLKLELDDGDSGADWYEVILGYVAK